MSDFNWISIALGFGIGILLSGLVLLFMEWRIIFVNLPFDLPFGFLLVFIGCLIIFFVYWRDKVSGFS